MAVELLPEEEPADECCECEKPSEFLIASHDQWLWLCRSCLAELGKLIDRELGAGMPEQETAK